MQGLFSWLVGADEKYLPMECVSGVLNSNKCGWHNQCVSPDDKLSQMLSGHFAAKYSAFDMEMHASACLRVPVGFGNLAGKRKTLRRRTWHRVQIQHTQVRRV